METTKQRKTRVRGTSVTPTPAGRKSKPAAPRQSSAREYTDIDLISSVRTGFKRSSNRAHYVSRERGLSRLQNCVAPLIVIQAPAGYGKTTLIQQYCHQRVAAGTRVAWIHFENHLSDPGPILDLLYSELGFKTDRGDRSIRHLAQELESLNGGAVIVLDDFDRALSPALRMFLARLLPLMPEKVVVFIASRSLPALQLPRLRLREKVEILNEDDLRFTLAETQTFFRNETAMTPEDVMAVHDLTDGWPAALQCCLLQFRKGLARGRAAHALSGMTQEIIDYLAGEVFDELDEGLQQQLLTLCVPQRLSGELVEELIGLGLGEGFALLDDLENAGLFISRVLVGDGWYCFHGVFRRFLLDRRQKTQSAKSLRALQNQIAEWKLANGLKDRALVHLIDAGNTARATEVFSSIVEELVAEERLSLVMYCLERLPSTALVDDEKIFYAAVVTYAFRREFEKANALLAKRRKHLEKANADDKAMGVLYSAQVFIDCAQNRIPEMGEASKQVLELLEPEDGFPYAIALNATAYWLVARSEFDEAKAMLLRARSLHEQSGSLFGQAYQEAVSSTILSATGRVNDAYKGLRLAAREFDGAAGRALAAGSAVDAYLAEALYEVNNLEDASYVLEQANVLLEEQAIVDPLATKFCTQARLLLQQEDIAGAEDTLDRAICLGHRHGLTSLVHVAYLELARIAVLSGQLDRAAHHLADHDEIFMSSELLFHASEAEGHTICRARYLIHSGDISGARKLLVPAERQANMLRRDRRLLKIKLLNAVALREDGDKSHARRCLIDALEIGERGGFIRSVLDEGQKIMRLLKEVRTELPRLPNQVRADAILCYIDKLIAAEGHPTTSDLPSGDAMLSLDLADGLTDKEIVVLNLIAEGLTNQALSARLCISVNTVKWHLRNIYGKFGVTSRMQAVAVARHLCLLD